MLIIIMSYDDELPCGGYIDEDEQIKTKLHEINQEHSNCQCQVSLLNSKCIKVDSNISNHGKKCKKCSNVGSIIHKNEVICQQCLFKSIQYKCRLSIQNTMKVQSSSRLLLCYSGGLNSNCLIHIMNSLRMRYQKNNLFSTLQLIHIKQQPQLPLGYLSHFQQHTGFKLQIIPIETVFQEAKFDQVKNMLNMFKKEANTIDLLGILRDKLIRDYAQLNHFDFILKGLNGQSLSVQAFKMFAKGVASNISQLSSRQAQCQFYCPLRQHLQKQLQFYFYKKGLSKLALRASEQDLMNVASQVIDQHLEKFVVALQGIYSHTAPAILRTCEKIEANLNDNNFCTWCQFKGCKDKVPLCRRCFRIYEARNQNWNWDLVPKWMYFHDEQSK